MQNQSNPTPEQPGYSSVNTMNNNINNAPNGKDKSNTKRVLNQVIIVVAVVFIALISGIVGSSLYLKSQDASNIKLNTGVDGNELSTGSEISVSKIVEAVGPSVVSIITEFESYTRYGSVVGSGAGTGMIVSEDGYILTNNHVISNARSATVVLENGTIYENVQVVGSDPLNDIAFMKIKDVNDLPAVALGDSGTVKVGQQVVAIGNALGQYQNTVTTGILSGVGRPVVAGDESGLNQEALVDLLQTDAAINSGNSGGPLLNMAGQVIGINTAKAVDANNVGFAIPINATKGILNEVVKTGKVRRAFLGVNFLNITPAVAKEYNLNVKKGAYVINEGGQAVTKGSPAEEAGIKSGDIITKVDDHEINANQGLLTLISMFRPGDKIKLTIIRGGKVITQPVTLAQYGQGQSQSQIQEQGW